MASDERLSSFISGNFESSKIQPVIEMRFASEPMLIMGLWLEKLELDTMKLFILSRLINGASSFSNARQNLALDTLTGPESWANIQGAPLVWMSLFTALISTLGLFSSMNIWCVQ